MLEQQCKGGSERSNTYSQPPEADAIVEMVTATAKNTGAAVHRRFRKK